MHMLRHSTEPDRNTAGWTSKEDKVPYFASGSSLTTAGKSVIPYRM